MEKPTKIITIIYCNTPGAWDRYTTVKRWSDESTPFEVSNDRSSSIFPYLGGVFSPSMQHPAYYPKQLICSWIEEEMLDADYRATHPELNYADAILVN